MKHVMLFGFGIVVFITAATVIFPTSVEALGLGIPFGGKIIEIRPCIGSSFSVATIQEPSGAVIKVAANPSRFPYFLMTHPTQNVLGFIQGAAACWTTPESWFSAPLSFFYGTSI